MDGRETSETTGAAVQTNPWTNADRVLTASPGATECGGLLCSNVGAQWMVACSLERPSRAGAALSRSPSAEECHLWAANYTYQRVTLLAPPGLSPKRGDPEAVQYLAPCQAFAQMPGTRAWPTRQRAMGSCPP